MVSITFLHIFINFQQIIKNYKHENKYALCFKAIQQILSPYLVVITLNQTKKNSIPFILIRNCNIGRSNFKNVNMK